MDIPPSTSRDRRAVRRTLPVGVLETGAWRSLADFTRRLRRRIQRTNAAIRDANRPLRFLAFLDELRLLGLHDRYFSWEEYRDRLQSRLGIKVLVRFLDDPLARMALLGDDLGRVYRDEETGDALVLVSGQLDKFEVLEVIYHELGHVAGGHPLPYGKVIEGLSMGSFDVPSWETESEGDLWQGGWWDPPRSILGPPAPRDEDYCERDATLRAEYSILAGHYGYDSDRSDESFFRMDPLPRLGPAPGEGEG